MVGLQLQVNLGAGNDSAELSGLIFGRSRLELDEGQNRLVFHHGRIQGDLNIRGSEGEDRIALRDTLVQGNLILEGGSDRDHYRLSSVDFAGRFALGDTAGPVNAALNRLMVNGKTDIFIGNSIDRINITSSTFDGDSRIRTLGQNDSIFIRGDMFNANSPIDASEGTNDVNREVVLE